LAARHVTDTAVPGWYWAVTVVSDPAVVIRWPSTEVITSPGARPLGCAAPPHTMPRTSAPVPAGAMSAGTPGCWPAGTHLAPDG
jgi:hypothetical protein